MWYISQVGQKIKLQGELDDEVRGKSFRGRVEVYQI